MSNCREVDTFGSVPFTGETMLSRVVALIALPMAGLLAQGTEVQVRISAAGGAAFRIRNVTRDTTAQGYQPIIARGEAVLRTDPLNGRPFTISAAAVDSVSSIHIEAIENGRLVGTAEGPYVAVLRDSTGRVMVEARGRIPREPFSFSKLIPPRQR